MSAQPCLPQDILEVNKSKEYTLISTELLESVLTDVRLNAQTSKLWQILFNKARYNPNLEVKISYSYLAKKLDKSTRTIARYVEALLKTGYLIIKHNFDNNGGQRPSTISVRVPSISIEHAKNKKDRYNKKDLNNNVSLFSKNKNACEQPCEHFLEKHPVSVTTPENCPNDILVLCETIQNTQTSDIAHSEVSVNSTDVPRKYLTSLDQEASSHFGNQYDKNDTGRYDINVIQKENNKKDINKNNNNVVHFYPDEQSIKKFENEIEILKQQILEGSKQIGNIKDHALLYEQIKKNSQIEATLHLTQIELERVQKEIDEKIKQEKAYSNLNNNPKFIMDKKGERTLSLFTFKRLVKSLKSYGYSGNMLNALINEIVFEVRFGSLLQCNKTKIPLSIDNAINIGLKLVREKRWSTPVLLKTFI